MISVVVPAHNEASVIQRSLRLLVRGSTVHEMEIVVVCNGCTDDTAERARAVEGPITVLEIDEASKIAALNAADEAVSSFPRVYVDADVELGDGALSALVEPLLAGEGDLALPRSEYVVESGNLAVRSYLNFWQRLPQVAAISAGAGAYALSATGRATFSRWPAVTNDDAFIRMRLAGRTVIVGGCVCKVRAPNGVGALVKRKARVVYGNRELGGAHHGGVHPWRGWIEVVRADPRALLDLPVYLYVALASRALTVGGRDPGWAADGTSRATPAEAVPSDPRSGHVSLPARRWEGFLGLGTGVPATRDRGEGSGYRDESAQRTQAERTTTTNDGEPRDVRAPDAALAD